MTLSISCARTKVTYLVVAKATNTCLKPMRSTTENPAPWALTPKIFDKDMTALLKEAAERMYGIMDKVTRAFCSDASVRAWFRMESGFC